MQLLFSSPIPQQQFVSLSLLLPSGSMAEPVITASASCVLPKESALEAVSDLHNHILDVSTSSKESTKRSSNAVQTFRSRKSNNLALQYRVVRGAESLRLQTLVQSLHLPPNSPPPPKVDPSTGLMGVVLAVGVMGLESLYGASPAVYDLPQRIQDCAGYLSSTTTSLSAAQSLWHAFLLTSPAERLPTTMVMDAIALPSNRVANNNNSGGGTGGGNNILSPPAALMLRGRRGGGSEQHHNNNNDSHDSVIAAPKTYWNVSYLEPSSTDTARTLMDQLTVASVADPSAQLPSYATTAQERKQAQLDLLGGRFRRRKADDADLDLMDYKRDQQQQPHQQSSVYSNNKQLPSSSNTTPLTQRKWSAAEKLQSSKKDTKVSRDSGSAASSTATTTAAASSFEPFTRRPRRASVGTSPPPVAEEPKQRRQQQHSMLVNFALNEDLTCSYKVSQLAACSVEGVVQVQLKSSSTTAMAKSGFQFDLLLRDPLNQVDTLTENRKFVTKEGPGKQDYRFHISIPKADTYFPLLKYKCAGDLRPVPIRVQTKVKTDGDHCRVALQISSNPNNVASLSDLTIMLGAPNAVDGDSLISQPAGGVWEASKSSVLWCVSELNSGEKFQLQARFAMVEGVTTVDAAQFPVLVRCQSLQAQLSEVALEAAASSRESTVPTLQTKIARRYRVSHREKNG